MNSFVQTIVPVTQARSKLGDLTRQAKGDRYIILTRGGTPAAALVDVSYLAKLEAALRKLYQRTYIDPALLPYTREFTEAEIAEWEQEDVL